MTEPQSIPEDESGVSLQQYKKQRFNPFSLLFRWCWLPLLGAAIGLVAGCLIWIQQPLQYKAIARIQIIPAQDSVLLLAMEGTSNQTASKVRSDELAILQSAVVLRSAIEIGRLNENRWLSKMSPEDQIR